MTDPLARPTLSEALRRERRARRLSLRDLAAEIGVSFNTLSRVERGYWPDLKNYNRIVQWLDIPSAEFLNPSVPQQTTDVISRHLFADPRLSADSAVSIAALVEEMYGRLAAPRPAYAVHMRSARTFLPPAGNVLADIVADMYEALEREGS